MTLTEQWKKGELKEGWYYIRNKAHSIKFNQMSFFMVFGEVSYWTNCKDEDVEEVLAPVPSYEEWKTVFNCANKYEVEYIECANDYENVKKENQQLKELLKEVRDAWVIYKPYDRNQLCERIDNAIGEK